MAVAKGQQSTEGVARTLYIGVGAVKVLGVNPNKATIEKIYGRQMDKEPEYVGKANIDGKEVDNVRISFVIRTVPEKNNSIEVTTNHTFFLQKRYRQGSASGKYQIIDSYGRTAWATKEEIQAKQIPMYKNGPANISADYRPCYVGEEELTNFIKEYLVIPNVMAYVNGAWVPNPKVDPKDCEVRLDKIDDYFKGNFKELVEICGYQPENIVKVPFGVRTTDDNKQYQTTYTGMTLRNSVTDYSKLAEELENQRASRNSFPEFEACELKKYTVEATPLAAEGEAQTETEDNPW